MQTAEQLLAAPSTSHWLKTALEESLKRDPVDAASDATALAAVLNARAEAKLAGDMARLGIPRPGN